jgi:hypothetical protein
MQVNQRDDIVCHFVYHMEKRRTGQKQLAARFQILLTCKSGTLLLKGELGQHRAGRQSAGVISERALFDGYQSNQHAARPEKFLAGTNLSGGDRQGTGNYDNSFHSKYD